MLKRRVLQLAPILIAASFLLACGSQKSAEQGTAETVSGVKLETVSLRATPQMYEAVGTVRSQNISVLSAQMVARSAKYASGPATGCGAASSWP